MTAGPASRPHYSNVGPWPSAVRFPSSFANYYLPPPTRTLVDDESHPRPPKDPSAVAIPRPHLCWFKSKPRSNTTGKMRLENFVHLSDGNQSPASRFVR
jgi:hypothetical protein